MEARNYAAASRIIDVGSEREALWEDVGLEVDQWWEKRTIERNEKKERDMQPQCAGEETGDKAPHRCSPGKEKSSNTRQTGMENKNRRAAIDLAFDEQIELLIEHVQSKAKMEGKRLKLYEDRLHFERWKGEEDATRVRRAQEHEMPSTRSVSS